MAMPEMQHASDSKHCRRCGAAYVYDAIYLGHLGRYHCPNCGQQRPEPERARPKQIALHGTRGARFALRTPEGEATVELPLPGLYNVYNALGGRRAVPRARRRAWRRSWPVWRRWPPRSAARSGSPEREP